MTTPSRVWSPEPPVDVAALRGLRIWLAAEGYVLCTSPDPDAPLVLAATTDSPDASGVPAGTRREVPGLPRLLDLVPPGHGLLVDGASPGRRVVPAADLDQWRNAMPAAGDEPSLDVGPVPPAVAPVAAGAVAAATSAGSRHGLAAWATADGRSSLLIALHEPTAEAFDAALQVVQQQRLHVPVRVLDMDSLDGSARARLLRGAGRRAGGRTNGRRGGRQVPAVLRAFLRRLLPGVTAAVVAAGLVWQAARAL